MPSKITVLFCLGMLLPVSCEQKKKKKPTPDTNSRYGDESLFGNQYNNSNGFNDQFGNSYSNPLNSGYELEITEQSTTGTMLFVSLRRPVSWNFVARPRSGTGTGTITSITANPQPANMIISGTSVTFTPQNQQEMQGTLTVVGDIAGASNLSGLGSGSQSRTQTFSWRAANGSEFQMVQNNGNDNALPLILLSTLPQLLSGNPSPQGIASGITQGLVLNSVLNQQNNQAYNNQLGYNQYSNGINPLNGQIAGYNQFGNGYSTNYQNQLMQNGQYDQYGQRTYLNQNTSTLRRLYLDGN